MADPLSSLGGVFELSLADPMGLVTNLIVSTIVSGIVILVIVMLFAKKFAESVSPLNAFILAFVVTLINLFGVVGLLGGILISLPLGSIIVMLLPILVWIVLVKVFFKEMSFLHVVIISFVCYLVSIYVIPMLVGTVGALLPI
jgi:hypothetical protein